MRKWLAPRAQDCESSHCVEIAPGEDKGNFYLRSSTLPQFKVLLTGGELRAFIASAKAGHYDGLVEAP